MRSIEAAIVEAALDAIIACDDRGMIRSFNPAAEKIFGYAGHEMLGRNVNLLMPSPDHERHDGYIAAYRATGKPQIIGIGREVVGLRKNGAAFPMHLSVTEGTSRDGHLFVAIIRDVSEKHRHEQMLRDRQTAMERYLEDAELARGQLEEQTAAMITLAEQLHAEKQALEESQRRIEYMAHHDSLTDLPNRVLFHDCFREAIAHAERSGMLVAMLYIDLDNFKVVNDTLGHEGGDGLLRQAAVRLRGTIRDDGLAARLGGDEFAVMLPHVPRAGFDDACKLAQRVVDDLAIPVRLPDRDIHTGASVGIAVYPLHGQAYDDILRCADDALYRAKRAGRGRFKLFGAAN